MSGHATGALVLGIIELLIGIVHTIYSFVLASKAEIKAQITPYWAGFTVLWKLNIGWKWVNAIDDASKRPGKN